MMRRTGMAFLCGLAAMWLVGCNKPCATTSDCSNGDVCSAAICRALSCEEAIFARDPATGACVALSGCYLTSEQATWQTCQEDPCTGLAESSCLSDTRCQPTYSSPEESGLAQGSDVIIEPGISCGGRGEVDTFPTPGPNGFLVAPGVNNGTQPKHGRFGNSCLSGNSRAFAGCRAVPQITAQRSCTELSKSQCEQRRDCTTKVDPLFPTVISSPDDPRLKTFPNNTTATGECFELHARQTTCDFADAVSCLTNPECQAIGTRCYCPPGGACECSGGKFLGCEKNDHLRRCSSSAECGAGERCDNDEACIMPRTYTSLPLPPSGPGAANCLGACVPTGCAGLGENRCNADASCNAGTYGTVCHPQPYCTSKPNEDFGTGFTPGDGTGSTCGCENEFIACAPQSPLTNLTPDRSLLVREAAIIDDPAFSLQTVLTKLAPAGQVDALVGSLMSQLGAAKTVQSGATTAARMGFSRFLQDLGTGSGLAQRYTKLMATTALINRLDLASAGNCGEARLSFAMTSAYTNGNQRMTLIVELKVPDDGNSCKLVAQRWAELSLMDDVAQRRTSLIALYDDLLKPENLGQLRTNEFINSTGLEAWELREFHLRADGLLDLVPVAQTVDPKQVDSSALVNWVNANAASLKAGTAIVPAQFLAGSSTENGARLNLTRLTTDRTELEKAVNGLACAGCHLTETKSPFVHIGERLAQKVGSEYRPVGRAVIDDFLQKELPKRAKILNQVLTASQALVAQDWRPATQARVH